MILQSLNSYQKKEMLQQFLSHYFHMISVMK